MCSGKRCRGVSFLSSLHCDVSSWRFPVAFPETNPNQNRVHPHPDQRAGVTLTNMSGLRFKVSTVIFEINPFALSGRA